MLLLWLAIGSFAVSNATEPRKISTAKTAHEVWTEMTRSSLTHEPLEFQVSPTAGAVSFGGEKEGGDALITRIMSPSSEDFKTIVKTLRKDKQKAFLSDLLNGLAAGRYAILDAPIDMNQKTIPLPKPPIKRQYGRLSTEELHKEFDQWLAQTHDRPFAFLTPKVRAQIFDGEFKGMSDNGWIDRAMAAYPRLFDPSRSTDPVPTHFNNWKPIYGDPEKYISRMVTELLGDWELNFRPQTSYGEFEKMMTWFRNALKDEEGRYNAFGHQWVVLPKKEIHGSKFKSIVERKLAEVYKAAQALIVLRGNEMNSGILTSMYNESRPDHMLRSHNTERSVIRLKDNLFPSNTKAPALNIEQRSGTSYDPTRRIVQQAIVSRYYSNDWSGLSDSNDYTLIPKDTDSIPENLTKRFGVSEFEATRAMSRIKSVTFEGDEEMVKGLRNSSLAPFWNWDDAPFLSKTKKEYVKKVTRNFIQQLAAIPESSPNEIEEKIFEEFSKWAAITDIDTDIETYLKPKAPEFETKKFGQFESKAKNIAINVNEFDFGIEYTTRFPLRPSSRFTENKLKLGKSGFIQLDYDLTPAEKRVVIQEIAAKLSEKINGSPIPPKQVDAAGHGHSIAITYEVPTPSGNTWRVEWDGIGREYDSNGKVIKGSERGGVVEIVTPKFVPNQKEIGALFEVFEELGINPSFRSGGGHINFDLNVFANRPKEFAKFIALFLQNRDVITAMFQHPGRFTTAEPHAVDQAFVDKLLNFNGTEEDLKKLLYNEQFFNTRLGRKTKYVQLEVSSYFQDVIPAEFISKDFDIKNDLWRRQFRVSPKIRKGEFRIFGAPRDLTEAHLQIKLVRAMMDKSLNNPESIHGKLAPLELESMVKNAPHSFRRFQEMMTDLNLPPQEYEGLYADGLQNVRYYVDSAFFEPYEQKMNQTFPRTDGWKTAVNARPPNEALTSKEKIWVPVENDSEALKLKELRESVKRQADYARRKEGLKPGEPLKQVWRTYDSGTVSTIKQLRWTSMIEYPEVAIDYVYEKYVAQNALDEARERISELQNFHQSKVTLASNGNQSIDALLAEMVMDTDRATDPDRWVFLVLSIQDGKVAGTVASRIFAEGGPNRVGAFLKGLADKPAQFRSDLISSIELRRGLYPTHGIQFETGWGDLFKQIVDLAKKPSEKLEIMGALGVLFRTNDVSLAPTERDFAFEFAKTVQRFEIAALKNANAEPGKALARSCVDAVLYCL